MIMRRVVSIFMLVMAAAIFVSEAKRQPGEGLDLPGDVAGNLDGTAADLGSGVAKDLGA